MNGVEQRIEATREAAARARSLSAYLSLREERDRVLASAAALDARADALELELAPTPGCDRDAPAFIAKARRIDYSLTISPPREKKAGK
jgi:hypothetical protein